MGRDVQARLHALGTRMAGNLRESITVDTRTLAVFRVFAGLLIVADVILRSRNFWFFYAESGVMTREWAMRVTSDAFSFFWISTDPRVIALLMVVHMLVAIQLIVGYKTRVAVILSFLFVMSFDQFNPFITSYADTLFRLLLFWAIFLPLGERYSIDAVHRERTPRATFVGIASAGILCQMVMMYFTNGYHKTQSDIWGTGTAAPRVMGRDDITFLFGEYTREIPTLVGYGGIGWFYILVASPILLFLVGRLRFIAMLPFAGGHLSFALTVRIGAFAYVALLGLLLFVQPQVWRDGKAVLARAGVEAQSVYDRLRPLERIAHAAPERRVPGETQREVRAQMYTLSVVTIAAVVVLFTIGSYVPAAALGPAAPAFDDDSPHKQQIEETANTFDIDQPTWTIFAPTPGTHDRYHVFVAETENGELLDVYNDRALTFDRPYDGLQKQYDTYRERFYMNSIRRAGTGSTTMELLGDYICDRYQEEHDITLTQINVYSVTERAEMDPLDDPDERRTWTQDHHAHACGDEQPEWIDLPEEGLGERAP